MTTLTTSRPSSVGRFVHKLVGSRESGIVFAVILVLAIATAVNPAFLFSGIGWRNFLLNPAIYVILSVGSAVVIVTRNVDLSVGSTLGLTAYATGSMFVKFPGISPVIVVISGVLLGVVLGLVNGLLVAYGRVPAMVITLGTMYIYRGLDVAWAGSNRINPQNLPASFQSIGTTRIVTIPVITIIALLVVLLLAWMMKHTHAGREYYAMGSDPDAAGLYGLPIVRRTITAFVISGACAGLAGVLYTAWYGTVDSQAGYGMELTAIGGAVIGGVAIVGGVGTIWGAAFGAMLLITIGSALPVIGVPDFWQEAVVGVLIVGAIVLDHIVSVRQRRRLVAERRDS